MAEQSVEAYSENGLGLLAVINKQTGEFLGQAGITLQEYKGENVHEIGYLFKRKYWHNAYASEAATALKEHAFLNLNLTEIYSIIRDTNSASIAVAKRVGMQPCGTLVKHYRGITMPHTAYKITRL